MRCNGICHRYKVTTRPSGMSRYEAGQKRCNHCNIYLEWEGIFCPCCSFRLRMNSRYMKYKEKFREHQPPMLIVWGANDYIFPEPGAHPYERDLNDVEKHILDTGHFALEDHLDFIAEKISNFLNLRLQ
ncbi:MAG: hypothetical protein NPMRTHETA2_1990003 [Nitrosopumilales archaeon]|nr:MAG: hypothetical protein NPMRTHETA2_1990003 [Nitrosopumilales archaeon]